MKKYLALFLALSMLLSTAAFAETATVRGFGGDVTVEVEADANGKITALNITAANETPGIGAAAVEPMTKAILEAGSTEVDVVAGATVTSTAIINAVNSALAGGNAAENNGYTAGTYTASAEGRIGTVTVCVTVSENEIVSVEVTENGDSPAISNLPAARIPADIVANQSLAVDTVSGATMTSNAVIKAAADALAQAGANIDTLYAAPVAHTAQAAEDMETQVVVVGGGMSGLVAAVTAAQKGADVVLVEKMDYLGGTLIIAGGGMITVNSETNPEDIDDSLDTIVNYFKMVNETSVRQPDYDFVEKTMLRTGEAIDYLVTTFSLDATPKFANYARTYVTDGPTFATILTNLCEENGVKVLKGTAAKHLVAESGKVTGVVAENDGGEFTINARKVILATGGAGHDAARMLAANPELNVIDFYNEAPVSNTGDGFAMMEEVGAQMADGPYIKSASPDFHPSFRYTFKTTPSQAATMVVNAEGKRFANEAPYAATILNTYLLREASPAYYALFQADKMSEEFIGQCEGFVGANNNAMVVKADSIEEIAALCGMDPAVLGASYARYQELCAAGEDADFGKAAGKLLAYTDGEPFYAVRVYPASWGTIGGAITDENFRVFAQDGGMIENLYAVGECATSKLFGDYYLGSFSLGYYTTMGYIAGSDAAASVK